MYLLLFVSPLRNPWVDSGLWGRLKRMAVQVAVTVNRTM